MRAPTTPAADFTRGPEPIAQTSAAITTTSRIAPSKTKGIP